MGTISKDVFDATTILSPMTPVHRLQSMPAIIAQFAKENDVDGQTTNAFENLELEMGQDTGSNINLMRVSKRSNVARSRLLALRRKVARCTHSHLRRADATLGDRSIRDLRAMRAHIFYDAAEKVQQYSLPLRIATHSINFALIIAVLPIGAASLTYSLLRGEDIAITGRLATLAGLVLVFGGGHATNLLGAI